MDLSTKAGTATTYTDTEVDTVVAVKATTSAMVAVVRTTVVLNQQGRSCQCSESACGFPVPCGNKERHIRGVVVGSPLAFKTYG